MTLPYSERRTSTFTADGVQKVFEFPFRVFYDSDTGNQGLEVRQELELDFSVIPESDYQVFFNEEMIGGRVEFYNAPAAGTLLYVAGSTPADQMLNLANYGRFSAESIETGMDKIVAIIQEWFSGLAEERRQRLKGDSNVIAVTDQRFLELKNWVMQEFPGIAESTFNNIFQEFYQEWNDALAQINQSKFPASIVYDASGKTQQDINNSLSGIAEKVKSEFVSVWDFFTPSELASYKISPSGFDAYGPIQEFLNHISANAYGKAFFDGIFYTSKGFNFSVGNATLTKNIIGSPVIQALSAIDTMFNIELGQDIVWDGIPSFLGTGNNTFSTRTCNHGLKIGNTASRGRFKGVIARNFKQTGIYAYAGSTLANFGDVRLSNIASGHTGYSTWNLASTFSLVSNNGAASNTSQTSTISVGTLPPDDLITECMVNIGGQPYYVSSIDRANNTLNIFPWLDSANTETSLTYIFGAGVYLTSGDASVQRFTQIDAVRCGVAVWHGSIYPPVIDNLVTQYCGVGQILGIYPERAMVGGQVNGFYCENNAIDILRLTRTPSIGFYIMSNYAFNPNKVKFACAPRDSSNRLLYTYANLRGITIAGNDGFASYKKFPLNQSASTLAIDVTAASQSKFLAYNANSKTVNINTPDLQLNQLYGEDCTTLLFMGSTSATPTGTFTFNAPTGYTVNGQASVSFSGFSTAALFNIYLNVSASNFIVSCHGQASGNSASITYDPPSLAAAGTAGDSVTTNVTLTGAALGNNVDAAFNKYNAAIEISAQVSVANTVTVKFKNTSAAAVDLPSGTLTVKLI